MKKWNQQYHDKFKEFALIYKVWDQKNLEKAWKRVKANKGSAGIDHLLQREKPEESRVRENCQHGLMRRGRLEDLSFTLHLG
ncbi:MAG: hypothetical protein OIN87_06815 [Candidatus Methanoperedens sp.]|nr:hypothetical protein [Candidatus Methanoperedens sp.]